MGKYWYIDANGKRKRTAAGIKHEYQKFQSSAKARAERASRNSARRAAIKAGLAHKGDGKDVHHADGNPLHNNKKNLRVISAHSNRGKSEHSRKRGSKRNKSKWGA